MPILPLLLPPSQNPEREFLRRIVLLSLISRSKSIAADEDFDDNASIAESTISVTKTRRNEAERIEYYKNQPECGILEPHAAQCTRCDKIVNLGRRQTYAVRPWELHRIRCDQKPAKATL